MVCIVSIHKPNWGQRLAQSGETNTVGFMFVSDAGSKANSETVCFNEKEMMEADNIYIYQFSNMLLSQTCRLIRLDHQHWFSQACPREFWCIYVPIQAS